MILFTVVDKKQRKGELCCDGRFNHRPDDCKPFVSNSLEVCRRKDIMVVLTEDALLLVLFVPK